MPAKITLGTSNGLCQAYGERIVSRRQARFTSGKALMEG